MRALLVVLWLVPLVSFAQATVPTALPMLEVPAQPAMGGAGVARSDGDPLLFLQNPALLGLTPTAPSASHVPSSVWFGGVRYGVNAVSAGTTLGRVAFGVGLAEGGMTGERRRLADGTPFEPSDRFRALGLSAATTGAVRLSLGTTARVVTSTDAPVWTGQSYRVGRLRGATVDVGAALAVDVAALAGRPALGPVRPALDLTLGAAETHRSGTVRYSGFAPLAVPRMATLGWSARLGLDRTDASAPLRLGEVEVAFQAERSLVQAASGGFVYASSLDGPAVRSAALGAGDATTTGRQGVRVTALETLSLSWGRFDGWGYAGVRTRSVELGTRGALALLAPAHAARWVESVDLRVGRSTVFAGTDDETTRTTIRLVLGR